LQLTTPILFLTYKRIDTSLRVFESIKKAKPKKLYFVSNAPSSDNSEELIKISKVRSLVDSIDWDCKVITLFRETHLEVKESISSSIDWFFTMEEKGIILEDDCVPSQTFYSFCQELLNYYEDDNQVFSICGSCHYTDSNLPINGYSFSNHTYIWGWATWKRAWLKYDINMKDWPKFKRSQSYKSKFRNRIIRYYWTNIFNKVYDNHIKTWDYQWLYSTWFNNGLSIIPNVNLVSNVGFGNDSIFTHDKNSIDSEMKVSNFDLPLKHEKKKNKNLIEQKFVEKFVYKITLKSIVIDYLYNFYSSFKHLIK
tara:strand:- start:14644 stop:15573 length:930 start_codon:yes stop_codon:yes gene_type:complete